MSKHLSIGAVAACGLVLAACSSSGDLMKTATPTVPLQFESEPPGAEVKTSGGQTCKTPCALAIPAADFQATFSLNGYVTQTVPVKLLPPDDMRGSEEAGLTSAPPRFSPSPVPRAMMKAMTSSPSGTEQTMHTRGTARARALESDTARCAKSATAEIAGSAGVSMAMRPTNGARVSEAAVAASPKPRSAPKRAA